MSALGAMHVQSERPGYMSGGAGGAGPRSKMTPERECVSESTETPLPWHNPAHPRHGQLVDQRADTVVSQSAQGDDSARDVKTEKRRLARLQRNRQDSTRDTEPFDPVWQPPRGGYCYRPGNDWSQCAGDHMPYPKRSAQEILSRDPICLHEPFCWKQLDWRHTSPSDYAATSRWSCPHRRSIKMVEFSNHASACADQGSFVEQTLSALSGPETQHRVTLCGNPPGPNAAIRNYNYPFNLCKNQLEGREKRTTHWEADAATARDYFARYTNDTDVFEADAFMFTFVPSDFELWMAWNRSLIVNPAHRVNLYRCSHAACRAPNTHVRTHTHTHTQMLACGVSPVL